jgi:hypothetical protein
MQLPIIFMVGVFSVYFLLAALRPGWRMRWGWMSLHTPGRKSATKQQFRKPRMGGLSCLGLGLFLSAFPIFYLGLSCSGVPMVAFLVGITGFVLGLIGQFRDRALAGQGWERYKSPKHERPLRNRSRDL